jgi:hypothetical protein
MSKSLSTGYDLGAPISADIFRARNLMTINRDCEAAKDFKPLRPFATHDFDVTLGETE